jgi:drug/metabolite transporter (DMT)-like permease
MGVVAPVSAVVSAALPLVVGMAVEGLPGRSQVAGMVLALPAMWLISRPAGEDDSWHWRELVVPALAGLGLGGFLTIIGQVTSEAIFWPLVAARGASLLLMVGVALVLRQWQRPLPRELPLIALAGLFDMGGNALYAFAAQIGRLDIASILSSLYPASTLFLAWLILHERLARPQGVGVVLALAAVMLIAT